MEDALFAELSRYLHAKAGIHLVDNEKNRVLMRTRLAKALPGMGVATPAELVRRLRAGDEAAHAGFVNAMTTNTTHFWREPKHFEHLIDALPALAAAKKRTGGRELRVWCAASSTGEEPYTLAMILHAAKARLQGLQPRVLATDIDTTVLARAVRGVYAADDAAALPPTVRDGCLIAGRGASAGRVRVAAVVRSLVTFAPFNLKQDSYPFAGRFDVIFCRNVLIYFSREDVRGVISRMEQALEPHGLLYLGHSETLGGVDSRLRAEKPAVYAFSKTESGGRAA